MMFLVPLYLPNGCFLSLSYLSRLNSNPTCFQLTVLFSSPSNFLKPLSLLHILVQSRNLPYNIAFYDLEENVILGQSAKTQLSLYNENLLEPFDNSKWLLIILSSVSWDYKLIFFRKSFSVAIVLTFSCLFYWFQFFFCLVNSCCLNNIKKKYGLFLTIPSTDFCLLHNIIYPTGTTSSLEIFIIYF